MMLSDERQAEEDAVSTSTIYNATLQKTAYGPFPYSQALYRHAQARNIRGFFGSMTWFRGRCLFRGI
jgi:hypothetical protein